MHVARRAIDQERWRGGWCLFAKLTKESLADEGFNHRAVLGSRRGHLAGENLMNGSDHINSLHWVNRFFLKKSGCFYR